MKYVVLPFLLMIYCELLGRALTAFFHTRKFRFGYPLGLIAVLAATYVLYMPAVILMTDFWIVFVETLFIFLTGLALIVKERRSIDFEFDLGFVISVLIFVGLAALFVSRNNGEVYQNDTMTYTDMVSSFVRAKHIGAVDYDSGVIGSLPNAQYAFQSYYLLMSCLLYPFHIVFEKLGVTFLYYASYIWTGSLLFFALEIAVFFDTLEVLKIKNKLLILTVFAYWFLFYGNLYWNISQAFIGNTYRIALCSLMIMYVYLCFEDRDRTYFIFYVLASYALGATASCNCIIVCIASFMLVVVGIIRKQNIIPEMIVAVFFPLVNLLFYFLGFGQLKLIVPVTTVFGLCYFFNAKLYNYIRKTKLHYIVCALVIAGFVGGSYLITHNLFDFSAFIKNLDFIMDMRFKYTDATYPQIIPNIVIWISLVLGLLVIRKDRNDTVLLLVYGIIICFFTPFHSPLWFKINIVYTRSYDIFINLFVFAYILEHFELKPVPLKNGLLALLLGLSLFGAYLFKDGAFDLCLDIPTGYDHTERMLSDNVDVIGFLQDFAEEKCISDAKVITYFPQLKAEFPQIRPLIGRDRKGLTDEEELKAIFTPRKYKSDPIVNEVVDSKRVTDLLWEARYPLIIISKEADVYATDLECYTKLSTLVNYAGYQQVYDNDTFIVYYLGF